MSAWGAPVYLPTGENTSTKEVQTRSWWERNADEERAEAEAEAAAAAGSSVAGADPAHVSEAVAAFHESHPATSVDELYIGAPAPVETTGLHELQACVSVVDSEAAARTPTAIPSTATVACFASPASKQSYWAVAFG